MRCVYNRQRFVYPFTCLVLLGVLAFGCQKEVPSTRNQGSSEKEIVRTEVSRGDYWLNVKVEKFKGSYTLLCNGFPVKKMWINVREMNEEWAANLQTALVGTGNVASIRIRPYLRHSGQQLTIGTVELEAWVEIEESRESYVPLHQVRGAEGEGHLRAATIDSAYADWREQAREKWEMLLDTQPTAKAAYGALKDWRWENPMVVSTTFDNEHGPDFSRIFEEAPVIEGTPEDTARLRGYAMRLRQWMAKKDTSRLFEAFRYKYAHEYIYKGVSGGVSEDSTFLRKAVVMDEPELGFGREDVRLTRWCEGRVWEVTRNGEPFFAEPGGIREVYVAEIDGEMKVVR